MKRLVISLAAIAAFFLGCTASLRPIWSLVERSLIKDVSNQPPERFPVLMQSVNNQGVYSIGHLDDSPQLHVVAGFTKEALEQINSDLRSRISTNSFAHDYFSVKKYGDGYIDVELEVPTLHDSMSKSWYRIQDGKVIPQRRVRYGPGFAFIVMPWTLLAGAISALIVTVLLRRIWPNKALHHYAPQAARW
jgi:hypothetical protein